MASNIYDDLEIKEESEINSDKTEEEKLYEHDLLEGKTVYVNGGELYVIATPIGRIIDISIRAIKVLSQVDLIAAEDTRRAYILLNMLGIRKKVISNQKFNEYSRVKYFLSELASGKSIAVISDAGTPCISDPGNELIKNAIKEGFKVIPIPGACAAIAGVSASGFDLKSFIFCGFFPKENSDKKKEIAKFQSGITKTFIYYESPKRIIKTIEFFVSEDIKCNICLCNDITKTHERFYRGTPIEVFNELNANPSADKGEYTLIIEVLDEYIISEKEHLFSAESLLIDKMIKYKYSAKDAIKEILSDPVNTYSKNELKTAEINLKKIFNVD